MTAARLELRLTMADFFRAAIGQGSHANGKIGLNATRTATLRIGGRSWDLPRGFSGQLDLTRSDGAGIKVSAPELSTSDDVAPGLRIEAMALDLDSGPEPTSKTTNATRRRLRATLRLENVVLTRGARVYRTPLQGTLFLEGAPSVPQVWTLAAGTLELPSLSVESSHLPREVAPLSARLRVNSGSVSLVAPPVIEGALELSGTELKSLLRLFGLPESVGLMISQFQHQPFELKASVHRQPHELWLRDLVLTSGELRMEGAIELSGSVQHGALLVTMGRSTMGVQLGARGGGIALGADRAWLGQRLASGDGS